MKVKQKPMLALAGILIAALVVTMSCLPPEDGEPEAPFIEVSSLSYDPEREMGKIDFAISVDASSSYLVEVDATDFSQLNLAQDSFVGWTSIEGEPKIPVVRMRVAIPPGMDDSVSIDIDVPTLTSKIEDVLIVPVEKYENPMEPPVYEMKEDIYNSDEQYPATWISQLEVEFFDGFEILTFEICPVRYRPIERDIYFYDIEGSITLHGVFPDGELRESTLFDPILKDVILNYREAMLWVPHQIEVDPLLVEEVSSALSEQQELDDPIFDYILVIAADDFLDQAEQLANHKRTRADRPVPTFVFSVEQIKNLVPTGDIPSRIREFIRAAYFIYGARPYIILLGDVYMMGGPYAAGEPEPPYTNYFELGSEACLQGFPQFAQSFTNAKGIVSVGLAISKIGNPDYAIHVGIKDTLSTNASDLLNFEIQPDEVRRYDSIDWSEGGKVWIHKHFAEHVDLDPTQTYYLVVYTDTWDSENYYQLWCQEEYEPDSASFIFPFPIAWGTDPWIRVFDKEMIFSAQLYHSSSVPARYVAVQRPYNFYDEGAHPSDYYYTCLDYGQSAWNADGDGSYCEYSADDSTMDFYPEGFVGRLPAGNTAEATAMVDAIIAYEQPGVTSGGDSLICCETFEETSSDLTTYASAGQDYVDVYDATQFKPGQDVVVIDGYNFESKHIDVIWADRLVFSTSLDYPYSPADGARVIFQDDHPFSWKESDFYPVLTQLGGTCTKAWDYGHQGYPWYYPRLDVFETVFNSGVEAVQLAGHGHGTAVTVGLVTSNMVQNDLQDTGAFPVVFGYACRSGYYDLSNPADCLGEIFVVTGKASSYVGSSRIAWGLAPEHATGFFELDKRFWIRYDYHPRRTGVALADAKAVLLGDYGPGNIYARHHILAVQLLGDPETIHK
jgi:hypothetical protein